MVFRLPSLHPAGWAGILLFGILGASLPQRFPFGDGTLLEALWIIGAVVATLLYVAGCLRTPLLELRHIPTAFGIPGIIAWAFLSAGIEHAAQSTSILETIARSLPLYAIFIVASTFTWTVLIGTLITTVKQLSIRPDQGS